MTADDKDEPSRWARVNELFHRALAEPASRRELFVRGICADDAALADEVLSLVAAHERADRFIEQPVIPDLDLAAKPPTELGHYRVRGLVGEGGMGIVYLADDRRLGRTVALKAVPPRFAGDATRRERLRREARAAAALSHPGIATIYALEEIGGQLYLATEYVEGETLRDELRRGPLPPARAVETMAAVARAVAAAHARGVIHRDLKPENVMRASSGEIKILDFGLAHFHDMPESLAGLTRDGAAIGTPGYMAPEQIRGQGTDARADIFAMGVMLHELLTGIHPFAAVDAPAVLANVLEAEPADLNRASALAACPAGVRADLARIAHACLIKSPDGRLQGADDLVQVLEDVLVSIDSGGSGSSPRLIGRMSPARAPQAPLAWWQFHQVATSLAYVLLLLPLWHVRDAAAGRRGTLLFLVGLTAVIVAASLRLHLLFTAKFYVEEWQAQQSRARSWVTAADVVFVAVLLAAGLLIQSVEPRGSALFVASAAAIAVSFVIIEPATTRAAFGSRSPRMPS